MRIQVDIKRSLESGLLCATNLDLTQKVNVGFYIVLAALFIGVGVIFPTLLLMQGNTRSNAVSIMFFGLFYAIGLLTIYGLVNENKLKKIRGKALESNKQTMLSVLKERYNTDLIHEGDKMFSYYKRATFWNFALRVIVLFDNDEVLINISRFNQIGIKSFFHPLFSNMQVSSLVRDFESKLN